MNKIQKRSFTLVAFLLTSLFAVETSLTAGGGAFAGGLIGGAVVGSAIASRPYYDGYYGPYDGYYGPYDGPYRHGYYHHNYRY